MCLLREGLQREEGILVVLKQGLRNLRLLREPVKSAPLNPMFRKDSWLETPRPLDYHDLVFIKVPRGAIFSTTMFSASARTLELREKNTTAYSKLEDAKILKIVCAHLCYIWSGLLRITVITF